MRVSGLALHHPVRTIHMTLLGYVDNDERIRYIKEDYNSGGGIS